MSFSLVGVGHNCLDYLCQIEAYPPEDGSTHITSIENQGGGAVATALAAASRLGTSCAMIGQLGSDEAGDRIVAMLQEDHVDTRLISRVEGGRSSVSFVMVDPRTGSRTKFPCPDALPDIEWTKERTEAIRDAKVLHLDGTQHRNAMSAAHLAKELGTLVSLDGCHMEKDNEENRALASLADILIMNAKYPLRVSGRASYEEALREMAGWGPKVVIATVGKDGCYAVQGEKVVHYPSFTVRAVDTTGAGDVFHGAFLDGYLRGMDLSENIRYASAVSAIKCTRPGGRCGIPDYDQAIRFLRENGF